MANAIYRKAGRRWMAASQVAGALALDLGLDTIKVMFVQVVGANNYTFSQAHEFFQDVAAAARITKTLNGNGTRADAEVLATKTSNVPDDSVFDADNTIAVTTAPSAGGDEPRGDAIIIFKDTGSDLTSPLIAYIDGFTPQVTFNGGLVTINWDGGVNRIFKLVG